MKSGLLLIICCLISCQEWRLSLKEAQSTWQFMPMWVEGGERSTRGDERAEECICMGMHMHTSMCMYVCGSTRGEERAG